MIKIFILLLALISILQDLLIRHRLKKAFPGNGPGYTGFI